ncbi:MAG: PilZ domain-containing protein [Candidatus Omnitrophica bacterium]|nr:PilZ domain-containing protein [Candidatus Omnitrophota bacterium]
MWFKADRRRSKRLKEICLVRYQIKGAEQVGEGQLANVRDISASGISMRSAEAILPATHLAVTINIPTSQGPVNAEGIVRQSKKIFGTQLYRLGIEFVRISEPDLENLKRYLREIQ